jgi:hypothetical protein
VHLESTGGCVPLDGLQFHAWLRVGFAFSSRFVQSIEVVLGDPPPFAKKIDVLSSFLLMALW